MTAHSETELGQSTANRPDGLYAFIAGLYIAVIVSPAVMFGISRIVTDAAMLYVGFLGTIVAITALAGWSVAQIPGVAVTIGSTDAAWLFVVLPFGWFVGVYGGIAIGIDPPSSLVPLAVFGAAGGMLLGLMVGAMSRTRYANASVRGTTELVEWKARWPRRWRRVAGGMAVSGVFLSILGLVAAYGFGVDWGWGLYYVLFIGIPLLSVLNPRTFRVTDNGLVIEHPVQRQFRPWSAFEGYKVTPNTLVIRSAHWWRPDHRCDLGDINDVDGVCAALSDVFSIEM